MDELVKNGWIDELDRKRELEVKRRNYREMHAGTAAHQKKSVEFKLATTLTEMRKILWGVKKKAKKI